MLNTRKETVLIQPLVTEPTHTPTDLSRSPFDPELSPGAHNAVNTCLRIQPNEKVTLITDNACREIAASIAHELVKLGSPFKAFVLEDLAPRPLTRTAARDRRRHGDQPGQHLRRQGAAPTN